MTTQPSIEKSHYLDPFGTFSSIQEFTASLQDVSFLSLPLDARWKHINKTLLHYIEKASPHFLIGQVLDFLQRVNEQKVLPEIYSFSSFEFWLNHHSGLSPEENRRIRGKIIGKYLPREEYQLFFPIGRGKSYPGSHLVVAHLSPDVDTMVASFWGWIDAFATKIGSGLHHWCLPSGPPDSPFGKMFAEIFGTGIFTYVAQTSPQLTLHAIDLIAENNEFTENNEISIPYLTIHSDVDEMRKEMLDKHSLPVVMKEKDGSLFSIGVVREKDLQQKVLGTVSMRDFCNLQEMKMAPYLEIISVVDHHKAWLQTSMAPTALMGDVESSNVLLAEQTFLLNDRYSLGGMTPEEIQQQLDHLRSSASSLSQYRVLQRLLQRQQAAESNTPFYVDPKREFLEYFCYLQAILDDTDLLSKVSYRDIACIGQLLNRLKSLTERREVEIIHFDDIAKDHAYAKKCAQRILQHPVTYSIYKQIFGFREVEVETNLQLCVDGKKSNLFLDTKEQNGCTRVGQTKMFRSNFPFFEKHKERVREIWLQQSRDVHQKKSEIDLYIHMISTIGSADEVYLNAGGSYSHLDEVWFWVPDDMHGIKHLEIFLRGFRDAMKSHNENASVEFVGAVPQMVIELFSIHLDELPTQSSLSEKGKDWVVVLRCKVGALNSRKSMITPYLPKIS